ncbi:hypothetical protein, partial [Salmonella enterica]|uniref:hypothetical protein n=1 Tax=Salmonella enterica TaxID=28901 RepID=UPI003CFA34ED
AGQVRQIARLLREAPDMTVAAAARLLEKTTDDGPQTTARRPDAAGGQAASDTAPTSHSSTSLTLDLDPLRPARVG